MSGRAGRAGAPVDVVVVEVGVTAEVVVDVVPAPPLSQGLGGDAIVMCVLVSSLCQAKTPCRHNVGRRLISQTWFDVFVLVQRAER